MRSYYTIKSKQTRNNLIKKGVGIAIKCKETSSKQAIYLIIQTQL